MAKPTRMPGATVFEKDEEQHGALAAREAEQARQALASEAKQPVRVVLEDDRVVRAGHLDQAVAVRLREGAAARAWKRLDRADGGQARLVLKRVLERVDVQAVVGERHRLDLGAETAQDLEGAS